MNFFLDSALLGLEYALLAVGVYITFRILNLPDLTVDGSFTFGMAVSTVLCAAAHPFAGLLAGALAGAVAGLVTGFLQTHCKIHPILAGILTMSGLYTVNITVLGGPNVSLLDAPKFFEVLGGKAPAVGLVTVVVVVLVTLFFQTVGGLCIRAAGSNEDMVRASSINTTAVRWAALDPVVAERVLHITQDIVAEHHITTMMVTHNIGAALSLGTRTIMLERGRIVLDLSGETRDRLDVPGLLALYREACGAELDNDRMLLAH